MTDVEERLANELIAAIRAIDASKELSHGVKLTALTALYVVGWLANFHRGWLETSMKGIMEEFRKNDRG